MYTSDPSLPDFRQALKTATQPLHDALEKTALAQILASGTVDRTTYIGYLSKLYTIHAYLESEISKFREWSSYGINPIQRKRLPMLIDDLNELGVKPSDLDTEWLWSHTWNFPSAIGIMYVMEGSTMGGLFLAQRLQHITGEDNLSATRYFQGYGEQTIPMWSDYCRFLNQYALDHPDKKAQITEAACSMFLEIKRVLHDLD